MWRIVNNLKALSWAKDNNQLNFNCIPAIQEVFFPL